jgi:hypothetical protein
VDEYYSRGLCINCINCIIVLIALIVLYLAATHTHTHTHTHTPLYCINCINFVHELAQPDEDTGETRAARLDFVVLTKDRKALLDVRIFHPLGPTGRRAGKYTLSTNENDKYLRYPTHQDGRRLTNAIVVPDCCE